MARTCPLRVTRLQVLPPSLDADALGHDLAMQTAAALTKFSQICSNRPVAKIFLTAAPHCGPKVVPADDLLVGGSTSLPFHALFRPACHPSASFACARKISSTPSSLAAPKRAPSMNGISCSRSEARSRHITRLRPHRNAALCPAGKVPRLGQSLLSKIFSTCPTRVPSPNASLNR